MTESYRQANEKPSAIRTVSLRAVTEAALSLKWIIGSILIFSAVLGALVAQFAPFPRQATVTILPLSEFDTYYYQEEYFKKFINIDQTLLHNLFVDLLRQGDILRRIIIANKMVERDSNESDAAFEFRLDQARSRFVLMPPAPDSVRGGARYFTLRLTTSRPSIGYVALNDLINIINQTVRERLVSRYQETEGDYLRARSWRETDVRKKRSNMIADYDRATESSLAVLDEQVALLKSTGTRDGQLLAQSDQRRVGQQVSVVDTSKMLFTPGYQQLERNAELIRQRTNKENFVVGLIEVDQEIRAIEQDQNVPRARATFERALMGRTDFRAVTTDLTRASFLRSPFALLAFAGIMLMGGGIGLFLIFLRAGSIGSK